MPGKASKNSAAAAVSPGADSVRALRRALLGWYRKHHRALPWRAAPGGTHGPEAVGVHAVNPYHVLVSEAMLQQTQVATVVPYFERFVGAFPTLAALAAADEQHVLAHWQGLGYYRRARHLHAAARLCVERFGGRVPATVEELLELPGVGRYAAGAIASIAYRVRAPILDGNVARVLARLFAIDEPVDTTAARHRLWALAEALVPAKHPGDFNQALMELGATVCTPRDPKCMFCPVRGRCAAFGQGRVAELPRVSPRKAPQAVTHRVVAVRRGGRLLFEQRPDGGLWSAMWQHPTAEALNGTPIGAWAEARFGLVLDEPRALGAFTHQTTHRTIRFEVFSARTAGGRLRRGAGVWRSPDALDDLPMANPQRRVCAMVREQAAAR